MAMISYGAVSVTPAYSLVYDDIKATVRQSANIYRMILNTNMATRATHGATQASCRAMADPPWSPQTVGGIAIRYLGIPYNMYI